MFDDFVVQTGYVFMPVDMVMLCSVSFRLRSDVGDRGPVSFGLRSDVGDVGPSQLRTSVRCLSQLRTSVRCPSQLRTRFDVGDEDPSQLRTSVRCRGQGPG